MNLILVEHCLPQNAYLQQCKLQNVERRWTGGFPNCEVSHFFHGKVLIVSRALAEMCLVSASNRARKIQRTNRANPKKRGKIPEKSGKSKKGQKRKDKSRSGSAPVWNTPPPHLLALVNGHRSVRSWFVHGTVRTVRLLARTVALFPLTFQTVLSEMFSSTFSSWTTVPMALVLMSVEKESRLGSVSGPSCYYWHIIV